VYWNDGDAEQLAFDWSRQFASHDERAVRDTVWNCRGEQEVGRGRLFHWADKLQLGWRQLFDNALRAAYSQSSCLMKGRPGPLVPVPHPETAPGGVPLSEQPLPSICHPRITFPLTSRDGTPVIDYRNVKIGFAQWGVTLKYDHFTRNNWAFFADGSKAPVTDGFVTATFGCFCDAGLRVGWSAYKSYVNALAWQIEFDSARDWLDSIPAWDGVERASSLLTRVFGCPDDEYHRQVSRLFAAQLVRRARIPGYKSDHMLILKSDEAMKKSLFFSRIVPKDFFTDSLQFSMDEKKVIEQTAGMLLCEMPELINITRKDVEHCKHFVSRSSDKSRLSYGQYTGDFPRYFTLVGSTNDAKPLQSRTGNRRFIIVDVHQKGDIDWVDQNFLQLWAEFVEIERTYGVALDLPEGLQAEAMARQDASVDYGPSEEALADALADIKDGFISHAEIYRFLGLESLREAEQSSRTTTRAKAVFIRSGWRPHRMNTARGYAIGRTLTNYICNSSVGNALSARFVVGKRQLLGLVSEESSALPLSTVKNGATFGSQPVLKDDLGTAPRPPRFQSGVNGFAPLE
jgi:hypothetical protein